MTAVDVWAPLGVAGVVPVVDELSIPDFHHMPKDVPFAARTQVDVAGHQVTVVWRHRVLVASLADDAAPGGAREIASGFRQPATGGPDSILWNFVLMPVDVLGETVSLDRERDGRDRWQLRVSGPAGRSWQWRPAGRIFADRMELTRSDDTAPVVTHLLRPVPGRPGTASGPPEVRWEASAGLAEVLLPLLWVLDRAHTCLLPKTQRVLRGEFL